MRILYGVVGEGMGHATRSRVVLEHLLASGHELRVVVSGRAHGFLRRALAHRPRVHIGEIHGLTLSYGRNTLKLGSSLAKNLAAAPQGARQNTAVYNQFHKDGWRPDVVIRISNRGRTSTASGTTFRSSVSTICK